MARGKKKKTAPAVDLENCKPGPVFLGLNPGVGQEPAHELVTKGTDTIPMEEAVTRVAKCLHAFTRNHNERLHRLAWEATTQPVLRDYVATAKGYDTLSEKARTFFEEQAYLVIMFSAMSCDEESEGEYEVTERLFGPGGPQTLDIVPK
jgi:hypothetical protein